MRQYQKVAGLVLKKKKGTDLPYLNLVAFPFKIVPVKHIQ